MSSLFEIPNQKFPANAKSVKVVNNIKGKKILAFTAHSDDLSIGAGGFLAYLSGFNLIKPILAYTGWRGVNKKVSKETATKIREKEMEKESQILGLKKPVFLRLRTYEKSDSQDKDLDTQIIKEIIKKEKPKIIFLPNNLDLHPRHRLLSRLILKALEELKMPVELFFYEIPWSVFSGREFNFIVPLSKELANRKINAIKVHKSQLSRTDFVRLSKALLALRAGMVPEQKIGGYGVKISLGKWVEVYKRKLLKF